MPIWTHSRARTPQPTQSLPGPLQRPIGIFTSADRYFHLGRSVFPPPGHSAGGPAPVLRRAEGINARALPATSAPVADGQPARDPPQSNTRFRGRPALRAALFPEQVRFDPEPSDLYHGRHIEDRIIDWDRHERRRNVSVVPQRCRRAVLV